MEKQQFKEKLKNLKEYYIVFGIIFAMFLVLLLANSNWPFGKNTIILSDSFAQIGMFFEHIFNWLSGEASLFYAPNLGSGVEIFSTVEYMHLNPFYLVILIGGKSNILYSFNIAVFFMFCFNAFVFLWFTKKYFKNLKSFLRMLLTVMFTFSAYINVNFAFVTWLIYPALTLLLIDAFLNLVKNGKLLKFIIFLVWFVINCYSVGVFANIVLVLLFSAYIFYKVPKENQKEVYTRLFVAYVVAVLISVVVLLPAIISLLGTSRMGKITESLFKKEPFMLYLSKISVLALDGSILIFAVKYLIFCDKKDKLNRFYLFAFIVLLVPIFFDITLKLLCGGMYSGFASRLYFLNEILYFILVLTHFNKKQEDEKEIVTLKTNSIYKFLYSLLLVIIVLSFIFLELFHYKKIGVNVKSPLAVDSSVYLVLIFTMVLLLIIFLFIDFAKRRKLISNKLIKFNTIFILCFSLLFNFLALSGYTMTDLKEIHEAEELTSTNKIDNNLKAFNVDFNGNCAWNTSSLGITTSYFSSLTPTEAINAYSSFGYKSGVVYVASEGGTLISDSLMGLKYYISKEDFDRPYLTLIDSSENYYLYENTLATTGAVVLADSFVYDSQKNVFENFNNLKESLEITEDLYEIVSVTESNYEDYDEMYAKKVKKYSYTANRDGILYFNIISDKFSGIGTYFNELLDSENVFYIEKAYNESYTDVAYLSAGETIEFYVCITDEIIYEKELEFTFLNYNTAKALCEKLQKRQVDLKTTKNGFIVDGSSDYSGNLLISKLNIDGMNYTLNGKGIKANSEFGGFASIAVSDGVIKVVAKYNYPYKMIWLITSMVTILLAIIILLVYKKTKFKHLQTIIYYIFKVASWGILSIFYLLGIVLSIFALIL